MICWHMSINHIERTYFLKYVSFLCGKKSQKSVLVAFWVIYIIQCVSVAVWVCQAPQNFPLLYQWTQFHLPCLLPSFSNSFCSRCKLSKMSWCKTTLSIDPSASASGALELKTCTTTAKATFFFFFNTSWFPIVLYITELVFWKANSNLQIVHLLNAPVR